VFILTSDERFGRVVWKELSSTGRDVCVFAHLEDAVAAAPGRPPGVIIVDVEQQHASGLGLARVLQASDLLGRAHIVPVRRDAARDGLTEGPDDGILSLPSQRRLLSETVATRTAQPKATLSNDFTPSGALWPVDSPADWAGIVGPRRALVADEDRVVRQILSHELSIAGWEVLLARDGEEARRLIDLHTPDVVVTDAELPLRTGLELLEDAEHMEAGLRPRFIVLSGQDPDEMAIRAFQLGAADFVSKPFHPGIVVRRLERLRGEPRRG